MTAQSAELLPTPVGLGSGADGNIMVASAAGHPAIGLQVAKAVEVEMCFSSSSPPPPTPPHHHQSLNREGRWGTTDNFATSFLHFPLCWLWLTPDPVWARRIK